MNGANSRDGPADRAENTQIDLAAANNLRRAPATRVFGGAGPTLMTMKWARKWEPIPLGQASSRFIVLGATACDLG